MGSSLATTNLLLGILAAVSVLEGLLLIGVGVAAFRIYRSASDLVAGLEARHLAPAMVRIHKLLDDVEGVTSKVREETERVDHAIRTTIDRVDDTADRLRSSVRAKTSGIVGFARGVRVVIEEMLRPSRTAGEYR